MMKKSKDIDDENINVDEETIDEIEIDIEKIFPNLSEEIKEKNSKNLAIDGIRFHESPLEVSNSSELKNPDVIAFLRRCETDEQGCEIIDYLLERNEITKDHAEELKIQLKTQGIRSFGKKKEAGYYDQTY